MMWSIAPWWHWLVMLGFWVLVVAGAVWVAGFLFPPARDGSGPRRGPPSSDATAVLDDRLARGEVDPEEYRRLRELLRG